VTELKKLRHNPRYLTDVRIDLKKVSAHNSLEYVIENSSVILLAVPSAFIKETLSGLKASALRNKKIISAVKGVVPETHQVISHFLEGSYSCKAENIFAISGPCHAEEVALEKLSYLTLAGKNEKLANQLSAMFNCRYIQTRCTPDIDGIEYSAVLKNVYAIACGIGHGLGYGDNFQAVLVSAAAREIERFLDAAHEVHRDVKGNAYLGDLLVTAYSQFSRNRNFGNMLGKGYSLKSAQLEMTMVAEGFYATKTMYEINSRVGAEMPILEAVYGIIYTNINPKKAFIELSRQLN
jgi:glycerol-3-phosphate dehydrogenase (NAD(P)+)